MFSLKICGHFFNYFVMITNVLFNLFVCFDEFQDQLNVAICTIPALSVL